MHAKMPDTTWPIWLSVIFTALVLVGLCRLSRWFYLVAGPVVLLFTYGGTTFLISNVSFRHAMIQELGMSYFLQFACSYAVPILSLAVYAFYDFRFRRKPVA
jgi:hypothetical protein